MMRAICSTVWAVLCAGCFSNADFTECNPATIRQPCGINGVCNGEGTECVEMPLDPGDTGTGEGGDGGDGAGGEGGEGGGVPGLIELDAITDSLVYEPSDGVHVVIKTSEVERGIATISGARIIEIRAGLVVNGRGQPGGPGGGAGAGQDTRATPAATGGESSARAGGDGSAAGPGDGGSGNPGSLGPDGMLNGGDGGDMQLTTGADGEPAVYFFTCADFNPDVVRLGGGGSGAGGGRGAVAMGGVCVAPGGGGGGAGGPGGGVIVLQATEEIIIQGTLAARGEPGGTGQPGQPGCATCDACGADAGDGGDGADRAEDLGGDPGGMGAGRGGNGGAGSGGLIVLRAPSIRFATNVRIDVSGGTAGPDSSGLVYIEGATSTEPNIVGVSDDRRCLVR